MHQVPCCYNTVISKYKATLSVFVLINLEHGSLVGPLEGIALLPARPSTIRVARWVPAVANWNDALS